jgi:hypothetical protein
MFAPRGWLKRPVARRIYRTIASSDLFDARWYRSTQVKGAASLMDPVWHYLDHGAKAGLDPSPRFDTSHYVCAHHDVRKSGLNPLFHYLEYGIAERRSPVRSALQTRDALLPESKELETFTSPRLQEPRVTMVVDSRSILEHSVSLKHLAQTALTFARKNSRSLRIIAWSDSGVTLDFPESDVSSIVSDRSNPAPTFDAHEDEYFLATSSTSALSLQFAAPLSHQWRYSSHKKGIIQQVQSPPSLSEVSEPRLSTETSAGIPSTGRVPCRTSTTLKTLGIFADALAQPVAYLGWLEELDRIFLRRPDLCAQWQVFACGRGVEPSLLAGTVPVNHADHFVASHDQQPNLAIMAVSDSALSDRLASRTLPGLSDVSRVTLEETMDGVQ